MKMIKKLVEMIEEELEDARNYAKCALKHKEENISMANTFYELSLDEMRHADMLHGEAIKLIEAHRRDYGEPPAAMLAVWEWEHEKYIERANEAKMLQAQYRGSV